MMPRTTIAKIAKMIDRELDSGVELSEEALAAGPILAEGGATAEIVRRLLAEGHRSHPDDGMIAAYAFLLEQRCGYKRAAETSEPSMRSRTFATGSVMPSRRAVSRPRCSSYWRAPLDEPSLIRGGHCSRR